MTTQTRIPFPSASLALMQKAAAQEAALFLLQQVAGPQVLDRAMAEVTRREEVLGDRTAALDSVRDDVQAGRLR